jgi:hypothetical protein
MKLKSTYVAVTSSDITFIRMKFSQVVQKFKDGRKGSMFISYANLLTLRKENRLKNEESGVVSNGIISRRNVMKIGIIFRKFQNGTSRHRAW